MPEGELTKHLPYVTHITTLRVRHSYGRHKVGHAQNIKYEQIILYSAWLIL